MTFQQVGRRHFLSFALRWPPVLLEGTVPGLVVPHLAASSARVITRLCIINFFFLNAWGERDTEHEQPPERYPLPWALVFAGEPQELSFLTST